MKKLSLKTKIEFPEDCLTIRNALIIKGYELSLEEVQRFWEQFSEDQYCAGFMTVDDACLNHFMRWLND